jgi:hypothetical protein
MLKMESSKELYRKGIDNSFSQIQLNPETIKDMNKYKSEFKENESLKGGKSDKLSFNDLVKKHTIPGRSSERIEKMVKNQLIKGIKVEMEHTNDKKIAKEIAMDHILEDLNYYTKLKKIEGKKGENTEATSSGSSGQYSGPLFSGEEPKKVETKEATGSGSVGAYSTPAAWAKSTSKKDWRGKSKTQIPGGSFVSIKKKCKTFPYCNQGDIKALNLYENESLDEAIKNVSEKLDISENIIKSILQYEIERKLKSK